MTAFSWHLHVRVGVSLGVVDAILPLPPFHASPTVRASKAKCASRFLMKNKRGVGKKSQRNLMGMGRKEVKL